MDGIEDLAQACIQPGLWEIEGIQVRRQRRRPALGQTFEWVIVWEPGVRSEKVPTLKAAKHKIVDAINASPNGELS